MSSIKTTIKRRQLEIRVVGRTVTDVEEAMQLIIERCFPAAYCGQVKDNTGQGNFGYRAYISVVLSNREDTKSGAK